MKRILVVNVNWVGDVVFSAPIFKALKEAYPQTQISCMAPSRVKEVLEGIPAIDEIIVYDEQGSHRQLLAKLRLIWELKKKHFDGAFLLHRSLTRAFLVFLSGIPQRIGYDTKGRGRLLTQKVPFLKKEDVHRGDYYLNVIESFGVQVKDRKSELIISEEAQKEMEGILSCHGIGKGEYLVVVNPGGNWDLKRWPPRNFTLLIDRLMNDLNMKVVISGAEKDVALAQEISGPLTQKPPILAGQTNLRQLMALLKRADIVISADSGPLHLANSLGTKVIGIFGPTRPEITGPRGNSQFAVLQNDVGCNRKACYYLECKDNICMQAITVEEVLDSVTDKMVGS